MMRKIGRNDPCHCGSGRKYKKCCMMKEKAEKRALHAHQGAVGKAIDWLWKHYNDQLHAWIEHEWFADLDMDQSRSISPDESREMEINAMELMLAEGRFCGELGEEIGFMDKVLGKGGPLMSAEQRQYLQALQQAPLRLWEVTEVLPGVGLTLTDCMDEACIRQVLERSASLQIKQWDVIGARPVQISAGHWVLSGATYHFPRSDVETVRLALSDCTCGVAADDLPSVISKVISDEWLRLVLNPEPFMPQMVDAATGESLMFITEHYRVRDWDGLEARLKGAANVNGDRKQGWHRLKKLDKDSYRSLVAINISGKKDRIELFTKSIKAADAQQVWFEQLAGDTVRRLTRELGDPLSMLQRGEEVKAVSGSDIPDDVQRKMEHDYKRKHYADWADTPLPALQGKTARQAVKSQAGRKTVISMLKDFENAEARNEHPFDFGFLWKDLGLEG